jgi:membrane-bound metal-dependent hydrolase YbcI (DUF457 family)
MPFTPFHFGPGYLIKSFFVKRFHFLAFVVSQVLIDCETAYNIFAVNARLHSFLHTYLGSLVVIPLSLLVVWGLYQLSFLKKYLIEEFNVKVVLASLLVGTWSHVLLDSIMHSDVRPFWPVDSKNIFDELIGVRALHILCFVCGAVGMFWTNRAEFKKLK